MSRSNKRASIGDRISALPDDVLHHIMASLTAQEAVQTCVLSRRWRNVWPSVRCLNADAAKFTSLERFKNFVDNLFLHRDCTPLHTLWLDFTFDDFEFNHFSDYSEICPWVNQALRSNAQVLGIVHDTQAEALAIEGSFTSLHLKRLHLCNFEIVDGFVEKLSSDCPVLEELDLTYCDIFAAAFYSTTLKRLTVTYSRGNLDDYSQDNLVIDMPNLVSLCIRLLYDRNPYLVDVSSLETASIHIDGLSFVNVNCVCDVDCNIPSAISNATNLESLSLTVHDNHAIYVFTKDVLRCGAFSNFRTLSLGEWCLSIDFSVLLYLLRYLPKIEKLILNLTYYGASHYDHPEQYAAPETGPACNGTKTPICENLKKIEINCPIGDERVQAIVGFLFANITFAPEINIKSSKDWHVQRY